MYFKTTYRHNPKTDKSEWYYRLVESFRTTPYRLLFCLNGTTVWLKAIATH